MDSSSNDFTASGKSQSHSPIEEGDCEETAILATSSGVFHVSDQDAMKGELPALVISLDYQRHH